MTAQFPLTYPPTCPQCDQLATRARSGHKRQFVTWDDMEGISSRNPRCRCGYHSRRNQGNGPIPSEWFACASKTCSFSQSIDADDEPVYSQSPQRSQGSTMSSTAAASPSVEDGKLREILEDMSIKVESIEKTIATQRSAAASSVNIDCSVHGSGRSSFFRRRRCICAF
ncbi:unnamed protein product [Fusarium equiseti]|uniref:Uncharacterized protein n=1 Tax=Fusarium equiseti TaxID=61235 RepID=A0A8J2IND5_FUSEQ|nr:unnamed protein product [Fusarium equiseti]